MKVPDISSLLEAKEGEQVEFKRAENTFEFDELAKYACALANRGGGCVVLGITDKRPRQVIGSRAFSQPERTRNGLMDRLRLRVDFRLLEAEGKRVLVVDIPPPHDVTRAARWYPGMADGDCGKHGGETQ